MRRDYNNYDFGSLVKIDESSPSGLVWVAPRLYAKTLRYDRVGQPAGGLDVLITDNPISLLLYLVRPSLFIGLFMF